jgi:hypothetical protein
MVFVSTHREYRDQRECANLRLILCDDPHCVDNTGDIAEDRQQDVDPELLADPYLQEYP